MKQYIPRSIEEAVREDLDSKMVFIGGPRQTGKTTLARHVTGITDAMSSRYLNWDAAEDRERIIREHFPAEPGFCILDEIHKYGRWRQMVKGLFDKRGHELRIIVTGSARLDYYRKGGDSLQGRYHFYRLFPFSLAELDAPTHETVMDLLVYGGFPEPFLAASERQSRRWSAEYRSRLIREDLNDLEQVRDLSLVEALSLRLPELVGSPLSLNALREDLQVSHDTVARWLLMLENLYAVFRVPPFGFPRLRALKKAAKHYHWDWTLVRDTGPRFENLVACHLQKWCCFLQDYEGRSVTLHYFRDKAGREVDFVVAEDGHPIQFIECKTSAKTVSKSLRYLKRHFPDVAAIQVCLENDVDWMDGNGIRVCSAQHFLKELV